MYLRYCITCKNVSVQKKGCYCATCLHNADPEDPAAKFTQLVKNSNHENQRHRRLTKREAANLAQRDVLLPTQKEYHEAAVSALAFFLKKKDEAIKPNLGKLIVISIAVVSKAGLQ
jgi:hypothetical protein